MTPGGYTFKSLLGPTLFVAAAYWYGQSVGRRDRRPPLSGLPRKGRVPMATVRRAMRKMPRKVIQCHITATALREGMEVEREHRDLTRGGALATAKIAAAHLCERAGYYRKLKKARL